MGFFLFLLLVVLILAGGWFYRRLLDIEKELRTEMAAEEAAEEVAEEVAEEPGPGGAPGIDPADRVLRLVRDEPGLLQTSLYGQLPDLSRRRLQELLRAMERDGLLRRVREGGSYRLFPG